MQTAELIKDLSQDLAPVRRFSNPARWSLFWFGVAIYLVGMSLLLTGPFRPGVIEQLLSSPRFLLEIGLGLLVSFSASYSAVYLGIPGAKARWSNKSISVTLFILWIGLLVYGVWFPALAPSMLGKRPGCEIETLLFAIIPFLLIFAVLRWITPIKRGWAGILMGIAACSLPAVGMHIACMYDPTHILTHHLAPVILMGILAGVVSRAVLPKL